MEMAILCNNKEILRVHNVEWDLVLRCLQSHIRDYEINISENIRQVENKSDVLYYGPAAIPLEITDYLQNGSDALLFAKLINAAIAMAPPEMVLTADIFPKLTAFHATLLDYAHGL